MKDNFLSRYSGLRRDKHGKYKERFGLKEKRLAGFVGVLSFFEGHKKFKDEVVVQLFANVQGFLCL